MDDITILSDAQLVQLMEAHRRPNGDFELPVDGWDKLSTQDRGHLAERLRRAQERVLAQNPVACSRPLDLDWLNKRLGEVSESNRKLSAQPKENQEGRESTTFSTEAAGDETEPYTEEEYLADILDDETKAYHDIVNDGGRPLYPIGLLEQVSRNPEEYREMLWPFWGYPRDNATSWLVFKRQSKRWQDFRNWQNDNRGLEDEYDGYYAYAERRKRGCIKQKDTKKLAEIEADPECLRSDWERWEQSQPYNRRWQRQVQRELDCHGFPGYVDALKRRLARHGFTRPSFQPHEDPKQQDQLTTWIEYLCFEYWWLDRHIKSIERLKPDHDKRWQELVDLKLLKPHETKEFIRTDTLVIQHVQEIEQAWEAREAIESEGRRVYRLTQEDPHRLSISESKRIRMLRTATKNVRAAQERYESAHNRSYMVMKFVRATFEYEDANKDAARQNTLLQWVREQIPLIEPKLQLTKTESEPNATGSRKRRVNFEEASLEQSHKKQKPDRRELGFRASSVAAPIHRPPVIPEDQPGSRDENTGLKNQKVSRKPHASVRTRKRGCQPGNRTKYTKTERS